MTVSFGLGATMTMYRCDACKDPYHYKLNDNASNCGLCKKCYKVYETGRCRPMSERMSNPYVVKYSDLPFSDHPLPRFVAMPIQPFPPGNSVQDTQSILQSPPSLPSPPIPNSFGQTIGKPEQTVAQTPLGQTLSNRQTTHGNLVDNSMISQLIQQAMRQGLRWGSLEAYQKESLQIIAHKIGRILSGDPNFLDHWHDIAGYATKVEEIIQEQNKSKKVKQELKFKFTEEGLPTPHPDYV